MTIENGAEGRPEAIAYMPGEDEAWLVGPAVNVENMR